MTELQKRRRCKCKECIKFTVWSRKKEGHLEREKIEELEWNIQALQSIKSTQARQIMRLQNICTEKELKLREIKNLL